MSLSVAWPTRVHLHVGLTGRAARSSCPTHIRFDMVGHANLPRTTAGFFAAPILTAPGAPSCRREWQNDVPYMASYDEFVRRLLHANVHASLFEAVEYVDVLAHYDQATAYAQ